MVPFDYLSNILLIIRILNQIAPFLLLDCWVQDSFHPTMLDQKHTGQQVQNKKPVTVVVFFTSLCCCQRCASLAPTLCGLL